MWEGHAPEEHGRSTTFPHPLPSAALPPGCSWVMSFYDKLVMRSVLPRPQRGLGEVMNRLPQGGGGRQPSDQGGKCHRSLGPMGLSALGKVSAFYSCVVLNPFNICLARQFGWKQIHVCFITSYTSSESPKSKKLLSIATSMLFAPSPAIFTSLGLSFF